MRFSNKVSKVNQVIDRIKREIAEGVYLLDDRLPSINTLSQQIQVSRDTVFKAYKELKKSCIVDSSPMKGYYVVDEVKRVLLLLDIYSPFKEQLYNTFVANLPAHVKVDLLFHQYNEKLFDMIVLDSAGKYNAYVVMNSDNSALAPSLAKLPSSKLLLIDLCSFPKGDLAYIGQNFDAAFFDTLNEAYPRLERYRKVVFVFPEESIHPREAADAFNRFCKTRSFAGTVMLRHLEADDIERHTAYICVMTDDLVQVVTVANNKGYEFGRDVGLVVYNDMPLLKIIQEGVSCFSIDFAMLGKLAAGFVMKGEKIEVDMPTHFIERKTL
jgi:DNA-binding transcriptional regulator YhcF (GntR family)